MKEYEFEENMKVVFQIPKEFQNEPAEQEVVYDWNGGVLYETEQNA